MDFDCQNPTNNWLIEKIEELKLNQMRIYISRDWEKWLKKTSFINLPKHNIKFATQYLRKFK